MNVTLVGGEGKIIKAPVAEIIDTAVVIPVLGRKVKGDFLPKPLCLIIPKLGVLAPEHGLNAFWYKALEWHLPSPQHTPQSPQKIEDVSF